MSISTQALLVLFGLIAPIVIAVLASPKALKRLGAWMIARAVALEDGRLHYRMTRATEHAILRQQYAIGRGKRQAKEELWQTLNP